MVWCFMWSVRYTGHGKVRAHWVGTRRVSKEEAGRAAESYNSKLRENNVGGWHHVVKDDA